MKFTNIFLKLLTIVVLITFATSRTNHMITYHLHQNKENKKHAASSHTSRSGSSLTALKNTNHHNNHSDKTDHKMSISNAPIAPPHPAPVNNHQAGPVNSHQASVGHNIQAASVNNQQASARHNIQAGPVNNHQASAGHNNQVAAIHDAPTPPGHSLIPKESSNEKPKLVEPSDLKKAIQSLSPEKPKSTPIRKDYFGDTSKDNQNKALKALGIFLMGFVLWIGSVHLICYNERRAVKDTEFQDYITDSKYCTQVSNGVKIEPSSDKMNYIVSGKLEIDQSAEIEGLALNLAAKKVLTIKYIIEEYKTYKSTETEEVERDGQQYEQYKTTTSEFWVPVIRTEGSKFACKTYRAKATIQGNYNFDISKLDHLVESRQTEHASENKYIHFFEEGESSMIKEYLKSGLNQGASEPNVILKGQYAYIVNRDDFNPSSNSFQEGDRRLCIKYVIKYLILNI